MTISSLSTPVYIWKPSGTYIDWETGTSTLVKEAPEEIALLLDVLYPDMAAQTKL